MVGCHYDSNPILGIPTKKRTSTSIVDAWKELHNKYELTGVTPITYVFYNETSEHLEEAFKHADVTFQLIPPHNHRNSLAESAIQTYTYHIKAGLAIVDPAFPLSEWDSLIEQGCITLYLSELHIIIQNYLRTISSLATLILNQPL